MKVLKETKNLLALMLLIGSIGSAYSQTFVAMRVNVSGQSNGGFLPEASIVDITGTYSSFAAGNPFQTFTAGPDIPGNSGFTYIESTGNLTFNLSNFGSALTFAPAAFNSFFRYEINLNDATLATPTQFLTTENNGQIGDYQIPPTTTSGQPNAVLMPDLHFDDTPITGPDLDFAVTVTGNKNGTHPTAANVTAITATWEQFDTGGTLVSSESKVDTVDSGFTYDETTGLINFDAITMLQSEYDPTNFNHFFTFDVQIDDANIVSTSQLVSTGQFDVDGSGAVGGQANPVDMGTLAFSDSIATGPDFTLEVTLTGDKNGTHPTAANVTSISATWEQFDTGGTLIGSETKVNTADPGFTYDETTGLVSMNAATMLQSYYDPSNFNHFFTFDVQIDDATIVSTSQLVSTGQFDVDGSGAVGGQANPVDMGTLAFSDSIATGPDLTFEATLTGSVNSSNPPDSTVKWIKATFERNDGAGTVITTETKIDTSDTGFTYDESTGLISFYAIDMLGSEYLPNGFDHTFTFEVQIDDFNLIQFSQVVSSSAYDLDGNGVVNGQANAVDLGTISYNDDPFIFNPLSGTYTIDPNGSGANNFTSFTSATVSMDLNGITGAVVFDVKPGVYQETAGGPNGIPQITGASATNTITFQNDGSGGDVVISPVLNGAPNACVYLNGADWLIFDGIDTAPDVNSTQGYYGFYLTGGSENNEIKNCNISSAANNNSNYRAIYQTQTGGLANNSNSYHDNEIHTAYSGIYISGASTNYDTLNTVYKNDIHDVAQHGIYFYYQKTVNLWGNDIHDIGTNSLTYGMNILVSSANTTIEVHDNKIHGIAGSSGRGLHFGGSSSKKLVYNNAIYDFSTTGQNLAMFNAGASSGDEYYYNTIYINETNSTQAAYGFFNNSAQNTIFKNNIIAIEKAQGQAVCQNKPNGTIGDYNNNVYFVDPTNQSASVGIFQGISGQSLLDWQTVSGQDFSSFNADPKFISVTDPHIDPTQYSPADNNGVPIASVTVDIDGDTRDANAPDIGVDEFSGVQLANDVGISGPITLNPSAPTNIDPLILTVTVSNFTATTETFDVVATLDGGSAQGGIDLGVTNLTLVGNADSTISFAWGTPTIGPHLAEIQTTLSNDQFTANDYVSNQFSVAQGATVPFLDTFGVAGVTTLNSDLWPGQVGGNGTGNPAGFITTNAPNPPSPPNAMLINADPTGSDTITSAIFDLSPYSGVFLKFWYQRGGGFEAPDANEFLRTWYLNSNNIWTQVPGGEFVGNSTLETTFTQVDTLLPPDAYHAGFRLRFTANGTVCACDGWAIDDVELVPNNDLKGPNINGLVEFQDTDINDQPFDIWAKITDPSGVDTPSVQLNWKFSTDANYNVIPMTPAPLDSFFAQIPAPNQFDVTIEYYVTATDLDSSMNVTNLPDVPGGFPPYSFDVRLIPAGTLNAQSNVPCSIPLDWGEPGANGIELKYDDGTSEFQSTIPSTPPGLNSPGPAEFASVFDIANQTQIVGDAQINSLRFYVDNNALSASEYKVKVVDFDDVAGTPGTTIIFESPLQTQAGSAGSFVSFDIADPVTGVGPSVGNGKFSIIIEQTTAAKISLGGDLTQQPPFTYVNNTFYIKAVGSAWATLESLGTFYGPSIPMVRCFVEPLIVVAPSVSSFQSQYFKKTIENSQNDIPQFSKASNSVTKSLTTARGSLSKARTNSKVRRTRIERQRTQSIKVNKNSNSISGLSKGSNKINVTPSWAVLGYNLYQLPGSAATSQDVVNTGTMIYTGVLQQFDDTSVMSDSTYSYAVTVNYDVNGTSTESPPGNLVVATTGTCTTGNPNITTTATSVDFGQIPLNTASVQTLQIKNSGNGDLDITSFTPSAPFTIQNPPTLPFTILAGDSAAIDIAVFLTTAGVVNGTLDIGNNTANNNPYTVNLTADGASPDISVSSTFLNFGGQLSFPQGSPVVGADTVTVTNTGSADLTISALNISGTNVNNFAVTNTTPVTVTPNSSVDIIVDLANITATGTYNATLEIVNNAPSGNVFVNLSADILILGIEDLGNAIPTEFSLAPNYPNPFNPTTTIKFGIPEKNFTRVVVYNALGQSVKTLVNETLEASFYELKWDGTDNNGNTVASGIYFARMEAGKFVEIRKMTFLK